MKRRIRKKRFYNTFQDVPSILLKTVHCFKSMWFRKAAPCHSRHSLISHHHTETAARPRRRRRYRNGGAWRRATSERVREREKLSYPGGNRGTISRCLVPLGRFSHSFYASKFTFFFVSTLNLFIFFFCPPRKTTRNLRRAWSANDRVDKLTGDTLRFARRRCVILKILQLPAESVE